jgi:hypothetical protein
MPVNTIGQLIFSISSGKFKNAFLTPRHDRVTYSQRAKRCRERRKEMPSGEGKPLEKLVSVSCRYRKMLHCLWNELPNRFFQASHR